MREGGGGVNYTVTWDGMERQWMVCCDDCDEEWAMADVTEMGSAIGEHWALEHGEDT